MFSTLLTKILLYKPMVELVLGLLDHLSKKPENDLDAELVGKVKKSLNDK